MFPLFLLCFPPLLSPPLSSIQYGQHSGKESIITTETRASRINSRSTLESMCVRNKVMCKFRDNRVFWVTWPLTTKSLREWNQTVAMTPKHPIIIPNSQRGLRVHVRERQPEKDRMTCDCVCLAFQHPQAVLKKWSTIKTGPGPSGRDFGPVDRTVACSVGHCCTVTTYYVRYSGVVFIFMYWTWLLNSKCQLFII